MTDKEISRRLALAIGWERDQMALEFTDLYVANWPRKDNRKTVLQNRFSYPVPFLPWQKFDYRDPAVIWPIVVHYYCFPRMCGGEWMCQQQWGDTPEKASALAVIRMGELGVLP